MLISTTPHDGTFEINVSRDFVFVMEQNDNVGHCDNVTMSRDGLTIGY